ncbi:MAG: DNA mismatch repair protein MutS [Desulfococcus sp. 4484_241]|nr:MAG: DNA mismatch repair protein MutS [Desulfococcus sp. 4484_241]
MSGFEKPVVVPIGDVLDLHTFRPGEVESLLADYFDECLKAGITCVRVIHGKGTGALKKKVWSVLARNPKVKGFHDAPPQAGGWGATIVYLKTEKTDM